MHQGRTMPIEEIGVLQALFAAAATGLALRVLDPLAVRLNLVDHPGGRKDHAHPTPITGGIAILIGVVVAAFATLNNPGQALLAFATASMLLIVVGLLDDKYDLRWWWRIMAQSAAALIMVYFGDVRVEHLGPVFGVGGWGLGMLAVPFTVFATVGLINAINMIDGSDGLAGLLVCSTLLMLTAAAVYAGNMSVAQRAMILSGAVGAFLLYNMRFPWQRAAKVYMGNAGSAFLGFAVAWLSFRLTQTPWHPVSPVLALWFLPIPVMDCLVLMLRRVRRGKSPFAADHGHIHHLMMEAGFTPTQTAVVLAVFSGMCGLVIGQALRLDIPEPLLLSAFFVMCALWYWLTARRVRAVRFFRALRMAPHARSGQVGAPVAGGEGDTGK